MLTYILVFAGALAFAIGGTPMARRLARRTGMTDAPSPRKVHLEPMPLLGGVAIYSAVLLAVVLLGDRFYIAQLAGILIGATLVSFLGLWDDHRPLRPVVKLAGQLLAAVMLVVSGVQVSLFNQPVVDGALTVLWVVAVTNALNFLDNMDGLSGGVAGIAAGYLLILAVMNDQRLVALLAAAVAGACVGFLVYNFNPASIFMGDGGALFLGFLLAALAIKLNFRERPPSVTWMVPVFVLAVPLFDLTLVVLSRIRRGVNPFTTAGKDHLSHRLVRRGATTREAILAIYLLGCAAGTLAIFVSHTGPLEAQLLLATVMMVGAWSLWRLEFQAHPGGGEEKTHA